MCWFFLRVIVALLVMCILVMSAGDALFIDVEAAPQMGLSPASGPAGRSVSISGAGFLPIDNTCTISGPSSNVILPGTAACVIQVGSGIPYGGFTIGNVLPGQYVIQVTGNEGDFAQAILNVG
jgi:hypothetical protein